MLSYPNENDFFTLDTDASTLVWELFYPKNKKILKKLSVIIVKLLVL